jgi:hypothetical protein
VAGRLPPQQLRVFQRIEVERRGGRFLVDCDVSALAAGTGTFRLPQALP